MSRIVPLLRRVATAIPLATAALAAPPLRAGCPCGSAADERAAATAGLVREWIVQLPFDSSTGRLEHVVVGDGLMAAQSGNGSVHGIRSSQFQPRLAFSGAENQPGFLFFLHVVDNLPARDASGNEVSPQRLIRIGGTNSFIVPLRPRSDPLEPFAALTLLAVPEDVDEKLSAREREKLAPDSPGVLSAVIDAGPVNDRRHSVARYGVAIDEGKLAVRPQFERAGMVAWSRVIGNGTGHAWMPTVGSRQVIVTTESDIHAIDRDTGTMLWERPAIVTTAGAAVQADDWVYVPLQTRRMLRLPVDPLVPPARPSPPAEGKPASGRTGGDQPTRPPSEDDLAPISIDLGGTLDSAPVPVPRGVLWSTNASIIALERTEVGWKRHGLPKSIPASGIHRARLELAGPPVVLNSPSARLTTGIIVVTTAGLVSRIELNPSTAKEGRSGTVEDEDKAKEKKEGLFSVWRTSLPERPTSGPLVSRDVVVVAVGSAGIVGLSATNGLELWRSDLAGTPVAVMGGRVWVIDSVGRLSALDLATGSRRQSLDLGCFTLPVVNDLTERLVLASPEGLVVSLAQPPARATPAGQASGGDRPPPAPALRDPGATPP